VFQAAVGYALRVLRARGLPQQSLQDIFRATVEAKLIHVAPAWSGFCSAGDRVRLNAFLHRSMKVGYRDHDALDFGTLFTDSGDQFFQKIINNRLHSATGHASVNYKLRTEKHSKTLTPKTTDLDDINFFPQLAAQNPCDHPRLSRVTWCYILDSTGMISY